MSADLPPFPMQPIIETVHFTLWFYVTDQSMVSVLSEGITGSVRAADLLLIRAGDATRLLCAAEVCHGR